MPETVEMILSMFVVNIRSFFPVVMCIVLLYKNTRVSEMTASFTRMGVSRKVTVPVAVAIRYIPTLKEEWLHIRDAMRMRSVTRGIKNPFLRLVKKLECYLVPLFVSSLHSADELSTAAVTRGIENPCKPTCRNYKPMGVKDYIVIVMAVMITVYCFIMHM
jgi:energy-coupling factor transport system permease protein